MKLITTKGWNSHDWVPAHVVKIFSALFLLTVPVLVMAAEANIPPVLTPIGNKTVNEGGFLNFNALATDANLPVQTLTYSLSNAPSGASITSGGVFTWVPAEGQGPGSFNVTVRVSDNGVPSLSAFNIFTITVNESNIAPSLAAIGNKTVVRNTLLSFSAVGTDFDLPSQTLVYSLDPGAPFGASINPTTGAFTWTPANNQGPSTNLFTVRVRDNGPGALSATRTFFVIVFSDEPAIYEHPQNQTAGGGGAVTLVVEAGPEPLRYQWRKNGVNIPGATNAVLTLSSVSAADSGGYSVRVWNSGGSVISATAHLSVLTDGANETPPTRITVPATSRPAGKTNLVVVTHGFQLSGYAPEWLGLMANSVSNYLVTRGSTNWDVRIYDWADHAWGLATVKQNAETFGSRYGKQLATQQWEHIHFIAHSAGSALIEGAAHEIKANPLSASTVIHSTFLDPYVGLNYEGFARYGTNADWADKYFARDNNSIPADRTEGSLSNAYNVDVTWLDPTKDVFPIYCSPPVSAFDYLNPCGVKAVSSHAYPHDFYTNTISTNVQPDARGYGFALSKEGGGWNNRGNFPRGNTPHVLGGSHNLPQTIAPLRIQSPLALSSLPNATSSSGVNIFGNGINLSSGPAPSPLMAKAGVVADPAWFAVGVEVTNAANFVKFDARFVSTNADGLLTVYWNTNEIGFVDEGVTANGFETHTFALPSAVTNGLYTLSFRLDSFNGTASSITVTNVTTGFVGVEQPFTLTVVGSTNRIPTLKLTGAAGFNYLLQRSTNLVDWTPSALLLNTNGTVLFTDSSTTNSAQRFYRALLP